MIRRSAILFAAVAMLGAASFATAADNSDTQAVYAGGHDAARLVRVEPKAQTNAPYALTGNQTSQRQIQARNIWVGSRFAGAVVVEK